MHTDTDARRDGRQDIPVEIRFKSFYLAVKLLLIDTQFLDCFCPGCLADHFEDKYKAVWALTQKFSEQVRTQNIRFLESTDKRWLQPFAALAECMMSFLDRLQAIYERLDSMPEGTDTNKVVTEELFLIYAQHHAAYSHQLCEIGNRYQLQDLDVDGVVDLMIAEGLITDTVTGDPAEQLQSVLKGMMLGGGGAFADPSEGRIIIRPTAYPLTNDPEQVDKIATFMLQDAVRHGKCELC